MTTLPREESFEALRWLIDAGADETIAEAPVNRFLTRAPPSAHQPRDPEPRPTSRLAVASATVPEPAGVAQSAEAVSLSTLPGAARALAASCRTLAELKRALDTFDRLEIKRSAKNIVFADGNPQAGIMFIGEAPGEEEDERGVPFVGRAGKFLDQMLGSIGLDRGKVYITNVMNWRPPRNRNPSPEEAASLLPFLHRHIELADPRLIVLLGAVSARHVLGIEEGITRIRGRWYSYPSVGLNRDIPVMPTLHPAYLLRQPIAKRLAWRDLCAIADKIEALGLV